MIRSRRGFVRPIRPIAVFAGILAYDSVAALPLRTPGRTTICLATV